MLTLLTLLGNLVAGGVPSNAAWDLIKRVWEELTKRDLEDVYLDAFETALKELESELGLYTNGYVGLSREELARVLHQKLSISVDTVPVSELSADNFVEQLAETLAVEESLILGGHTLSKRDYLSLIRRVVNLATETFKAEVNKNPLLFQQMISREALQLRLDVKEIQTFLASRFDIIVTQLEELSIKASASLEDTAQLKEGVESLLIGQSKISDQLASLVPPDLPDSEHELDEQNYHTRIDLAVELLKEGKPNSALNRLSRLDTELEEKEVTVHVRFRLITNIGACHLRLRDYDQAKKYFTSAYLLKPKDVAAITNLGISELHTGEYDEAARYAKSALEIDGSHINALSLLLEANYKLDEMDKIDPETELEAKKYLGSRRTLAVILEEQGRHDESEALHRENLNSSEAEPVDTLLLAQVVINQANEERQHHFALSLLGDNTRMKLIELEQMLGVTISGLRTSEDRIQYHGALVLRASVRALLGKFEETIEDCQLVLSEDPKHADALWNGGLAAIQIGEFETAIRLLSELDPDTDINRNVVLALSTAYIHQRLFKDAVDLLSDPGLEFSGQDKIGQLRLLADSFFGLGDTESAKKVADELLVFDSDSPMVLEAVASIEANLGEAAKAEKLYRQAYETSVGEEQRYHALRLADFYYFQLQPEKAVPIYEKAGIPESDCPETRRYLIALLNSGDLGRAYQLARKLRAGGSAIEVVSEVEAKIAYHIDDLENARRLFNELIAVDPDHFEHYQLAAQIDIRQGNLEQARDLLLPAIELFHDDAVSLMSIAQLLQVVGHPTQQVFELAYRARQLGASNAQVQSAYMGLFLQSEKEADFLDPDQVGVDTAVQVEVDGQLIWYVILVVDQPDKSQGQLAPNDPLSQRLMGLQRGDSVIISDHPARTIRGSVVEIQSKYVRAFQETIVSFNTNFPDESGPILFPFPIADSESLVALPSIGIGHIEEVIDAYMDKSIPLTMGAVAKIGGRSLIEIWQHLTNRPERRLWASTGHRQEARRQAAVLSSETDIVLELTALLTLWRLDLIDLIGKEFGQWYIAQSLLDEISRLIDNYERLGSDGATYMGFQEGMLQFTDISPEILEAEIAGLKKLRAEVESRGKLLPIRSALDFDQAEFKQIESTIGRQQLDSILIARETGASLYSDDLWLRIIAREMFLIKGFWSQTMLGKLAEKQAPDIDKYHELTLSLIASNYHFVSVNAEFFLYLLEKTFWAITAEIELAFSVLAGPDTTLQSAIEIVVKLLKDTWLRRILTEQKLGVLDVCLRTLCTNREPILVIESLRQALPAEFSLAPLQLREIDRNIMLWASTHRSML